MKSCVLNRTRVNSLLDVPDYKMNLPLPSDPPVRKTIEEGRCEQYCIDIHNYLATSDADLDSQQARVLTKKERLSNAHFGNSFDKGLLNMESGGIQIPKSSADLEVVSKFRHSCRNTNGTTSSTYEMFED